MGTVVPLEAQEGNKYILTLIMKAIVPYALAAFAAIAVNPIDAGIYPATDPYFREYRPLYRAPAKRHALELYEPLEYYNDYAVLAKRDTYSEEKQHRLTKREDLDTYLDAEADPRKKRSPIDLDSAVSEPR